MLDPNTLAWQKMDGLIPAIVQDASDGRVLMLAYMNSDALRQTLESGKVTFWSRSRGQLWTKGETSGNFLALDRVIADCDGDTLLVTATPAGPACHLGTATCFGDSAPVQPELAGIASLERLIAGRHADRPEGSYTTALFEGGVKRIAQKVGEEAVETALAASAGDDAELLEESADLIYHLLVLIRSRGLSLRDVEQVLNDRA